MDALSGRQVGGVLIRVNNGTPVSSDADGRFVVSFPGASEYRLSATSPSYVPRLTFVRANDSSEVISLIPASFNLTAFDVSLRPSGIGLTRWMSTPALVVLTREIQYTSGSADSAVVLDHEISAAKLASMVADLREGFLQLTDGRLGDFTSVTLESPLPGTSVLLKRAGVIVVARANDLGALTNFGGATRVVAKDRVVSSATIWLEPWSDDLTDNFPSHCRKHEMGHAVGFGHVTYDSVMNTNDKTYPGPTDWDRQAARIAYQRPPGNRTPDDDPSSQTMPLR